MGGKFEIDENLHFDWRISISGILHGDVQSFQLGFLVTLCTGFGIGSGAVLRHTRFIFSLLASAFVLRAGGSFRFEHFALDAAVEVMCSLSKLFKTSFVRLCKDAADNVLMAVSMFEYFDSYFMRRFKSLMNF